MNQLEKYNQTLFVSLGSEIDAIRFFQSSRNVQFEEIKKPREFLYYQVQNLREAIKLCQDYIKHYNLGGSSWIGGRVIDAENNFVAHISYNGRVWEGVDYPSKEIEI